MDFKKSKESDVIVMPEVMRKSKAGNEIQEISIQTSEIHRLKADSQIPEMVEIMTRAKAIVAKFDKSAEAEISKYYSITNVNNYYFTVHGKQRVLPNGTVIKLLKDDKCVRITLPEYSSILPKQKGLENELDFGYKYSRSAESNIEDDSLLFKTKNIPEPIEELDIEKGILTIETPEKLQYEYTGKNEFYSVSIHDFIFTLNGNQIFPKDISKRLKRAILFDFEENTFNLESNNVIISTKQTNIKSSDLFGYPIKANACTSSVAINRINTSLVAASLISCSKDLVLISLRFNRGINHFEADDFGISVNESKELFIESSERIEAYDYKDVYLKLKCDRPIKIIDDLKVFLTVPESLIRTTDTCNKKISGFKPLTVNKFIAKEIIWERCQNSSDIANNRMAFEFIDSIDPGSLIPESNFDGNNTFAWDGGNLRVPPGGITFTNITANDIAAITLKNNPEFGTVYIEGDNIITYNAINANTAMIKLIDNKKVVLEFSENENADINTKNIRLVTYAPYMDSSYNTIQSSDKKHHVYASYKPNNVPLDKIIVVKPLKSADDNPFKGGTLFDNDYILKVSNENQFRDYGQIDLFTIINGSVKICGNINSGKINLMNLDIRSTLSLDIGNGDINIINTKASKIVALSSGTDA